MPRQGKRTKAPPSRVWVVVGGGVPTMVVVDPKDAEDDLFEGEVMYRYDLHKEKK